MKLSVIVLIRCYDSLFGECPRSAGKVLRNERWPQQLLLSERFDAALTR